MKGLTSKIKGNIDGSNTQIKINTKYALGRAKTVRPGMKILGGLSQFVDWDKANPSPSKIPQANAL